MYFNCRQEDAFQNKLSLLAFVFTLYSHCVIAAASYITRLLAHRQCQRPQGSVGPSMWRVHLIIRHVYLSSTRSFPRQHACLIRACVDPYRTRICQMPRHPHRAVNSKVMSSHLRTPSPAPTFLSVCAIVLSTACVAPVVSEPCFTYGHEVSARAGKGIERPASQSVGPGASSASRVQPTQPPQPKPPGCVGTWPVSIYTHTFNRIYPMRICPHTRTHHTHVCTRLDSETFSRKTQISETFLLSETKNGEPTSAPFTKHPACGWIS